MLANLKEEIKKIERKIIEKESLKKSVEERLQNKIVEKIKITDEIELLESVNILLQKTSNFAREQSKNQIEELTTNCIQFIFENQSKFIVEIDELYSKASADFYIIDQEENVEIKTKPVESRGGGLIDIISLALRISFLQLYKPLINGPLVLDEPAKHVSEDYIYNVGDFIKRSSEMFNRQIIMVTHNTHLASIAQNVYKISKENNRSIIEKGLTE